MQIDGYLIYYPYKDFAKSNLSIHSDIINADIKITKNQDLLQLNFNKTNINYKQYKARLLADILMDTKKEKVEVNGWFDSFDINSNIKITANKNVASIILYNTNIANINTALNSIKLPQTTKEWLTQKITARNYILKNLQFKIDLQNKKLIPSSLYAKAELDNAKIKFNKKLSPLKAPLINIVFKDNNLQFITKGSTLNKVVLDINGSISNLFKEPILYLNIKSDTMLNQDIHTIIGAYNIPLKSIKQQQGKNLSIFSLSLNLKNKKLSTTLHSHLSNSKFDISNTPFYLPNATIDVEKNIVKIIKTNIKFNKFVDSDINLSANKLG